MHTETCDQCGRKFTKATKGRAQQALHLHVSRAHGTMGPGHGDLAAGQPGAKKLGSGSKVHYRIPEPGDPLPPGVIREDNHFVMICPDCGKKYRRLRLDLVQYSMKGHRAVMHSDAPAPAMAVVPASVPSPAVVLSAAQAEGPASEIFHVEPVPTEDGRWKATCPKCNQAFVRGDKFVARSYIKTHLRRAHQMSIPHGKWGSNQDVAPPRPTGAKPAVSRRPALPDVVPCCVRFCPKCGMDIESLNAGMYLRELRDQQQQQQNS